MVIVVPEGPLPKNSGFSLEIFSPSATLSKVTVLLSFDTAVASTLKPDFFSVISGMVKLA